MIMEKKMETTIMGLYWGYIGIMEKKMANIAHWGFILGTDITWNPT